VLLPVKIYKNLQKEITRELKTFEKFDDYEDFEPEDYIHNLVALARIKTHMTQKELAEKMGVTQAYISKIERQDKVMVKMMSKVKAALSKKRK